MGRLIDADEYEKRIKPYDTEDVMDKALYNFAHRQLIATPTAEKTGKWEYIGGYGYQYRCSACIKCAEYKTNYCPNCGARMVE